MPDSMRDNGVAISSSLLVANHTQSQVTDFNDSTAAVMQWWTEVSMAVAEVLSVV